MWVFLPGSVQATLCGRYAWAVAATGQAVGSFVYGKSYLNNPAAVVIDPVDLSGQYRLAPAFDLVPAVHATQRRHQALGVGMEGSVATAHNILSDVQAFGLDDAQAQRIFSDVAEQVRAGWEPCLRAQGLSASAIRALARCIEALPEADEAPAPSGFKIPRPR